MGPQSFRKIRFVWNILVLRENENRLLKKNLRWEYFSRLFGMLSEDEDPAGRLGIVGEEGRSRK